MPASKPQRPRVLYSHQLKKRRQRRKPPAAAAAPELQVTQILAWADEFHQRTGRWPNDRSGRVAGSFDETWRKVDKALRVGYRGLPGGSSLARLLAEYRGVRNRGNLPALPVAEVLLWADAYQQRTGHWPLEKSGPIPEAAGETWATVEAALNRGRRGLPSDSSLAQLLETHRGVRNPMNLPPLTAAQIQTWAEAHQRRTGCWPGVDAGPILEAPGETWRAVESALRQGVRGWPGGSSLAQFLAERCGVRNEGNLPLLSELEILEWADAYHGRTGTWPTRDAGLIPECPGEDWLKINSALVIGARGLTPGGSLPRLLAEHRGVRHATEPPDLDEWRVLKWADAHNRRTGRWPTHISGPIAEAPDETWCAVDEALKTGRRGLSQHPSLPRFLEAHRRKVIGRAPLTVDQILAWADDEYERTGRWPLANGGPIAAAPGETWGAVDKALRYGRRGLPGDSSLLQLLAEQRGARNKKALPHLTEARILTWARAHFRRTGQWPNGSSGAILDAPGETWNAVDLALQRGTRGLRQGGSSLAQLLAARTKKGQSP